MLKFGTLKESQAKSPLDAMANVRPKTAGGSLTSVVAPLMLTSLVDAFAVIVIYLLVSTHQGKQNLDIEKKIHLPVAAQSQSVEPGLSLSIIDNKYFINDETYTAAQLLQILADKNQELKDSSDPRTGHLIIQADKDSDYRVISPILSLASQTGFDNIKFATVGE